MSRRRGFFAEIQHQNRLAEQRRRQEQNAAVRAHNQALREEERARRAADQARQRMQRASINEAREADRLAKVARVQQMTAQANSETAQYEKSYEEIDSLLAATLEVDDFVELTELRVIPDHPVFNPAAIVPPLPPVRLLQAPVEPVFIAPPQPTGVRRVIGGKAEYERDFQQSEQQWRHEHANWHHYVTQTLPAENLRLQTAHEEAEQARQQAILTARMEFNAERANRNREAQEHNAAVDDLIRRLEARDAEAVDEYIGIVLANSVYPESFTIEHEFSYNSELYELELKVTVPEPTSIPGVKRINYVAASDELRTVTLSQKDQRTRYNDAVFATAIRTLHEVFEADRAGHIKSISLEVGTTTINPATGHPDPISFVLAAAERDQFLSLNLANVEVQSALAGISAAMSKNPFALSPVGSNSRSVRR